MSHKINLNQFTFYSFQTADDIVKTLKEHSNVGIIFCNSKKRTISDYKIYRTFHSRNRLRSSVFLLAWLPFLNWSVSLSPGSWIYSYVTLCKLNLIITDRDYMKRLLLKNCLS